MRLNGAPMPGIEGGVLLSGEGASLVYTHSQHRTWTQCPALHLTWVLQAHYSAALASARHVV